MYLKRLEIQGFKTFATRTVFEFRPGVTAVVGPNGSGKCLHGDALVTLVDGREVPIRDLVDKALSASQTVEVLDDGWVTRENPDRITILSLNPHTLRLEPRPVFGFVKREAPEELIRIRSRSGRTVTATPYHPLFTLEAGVLRALRADEIRPGIRIAIPRRLPVSNHDDQIDYTPFLQACTYEDGIYALNTSELQAWANASKDTFGTYTAWRREAQVPESQFAGLRDGQALNVAVLNQLAVAGNRPLPSYQWVKAHGHVRVALPPRLTQDFAYLLGLLIAEGANRDTHQIRFVNDDNLVNERYAHLIKQYFNVKTFGKRYKANAVDTIAVSRALSLVLERVFGFGINSHSAEKQVPPQILKASPATQWAFLSGLFEGDAHIHLVQSQKPAQLQPCIEYVTASERLARQVIGLLLRLGIFAQLRRKMKRATNSSNPQLRSYYAVYIYGHEQLRSIAEQVTFTGKKQAHIDALRELPRANNPNPDIVPGATTLVKQAVQAAGVSVKKYRQGRAKLAAYAEQRCEASRSGLLEVRQQIAELGTTPETASDILERLHTLATSDVYWDEVVELERITPDDPWVYDLSIAETHNFVADNIIVHNSNLADAVRWVLGEQSLTNLRCKRTEELLYAGGGRRAPAGLAEVSLTIDNSDRLLPLDFDEVTVTRRATRAGDNEYFINRARVRLRDLVEAVEPLGGSYTIINQGLVDAALTLRPEERRRLFEDAAEIGGFELRKAEALRRLRETEGNLQRVDDLLAELEPRLRSLKRQAGQARQHKDLTEELHGLQVQFYAAQWRAANTLCAATAAEVARTERDLDQARAAQAAIGTELHTLRAALRTRREALGALHERSADLHRQAEALQRDLAVGAERMAALTRRGEDLDRRRQELALRREEARTQAAAAAAEASRAEAELAERRATLRRAEAELADGEATRRELAQALRQAQDAAVRAASAVAQAASRAEQAVRQQERLAGDQADLDAAVAQAEQRLAATQAQVEQARADLAQSDQARAAAAEAERLARAEFEQVRAERAQADETRAAVRRALADAEARYDSLARLARSYAGAFAGVRAAMQWAERAGRSGFALVQSIIRTPAEIETAIETALGSRLQTIVVEHWEDAEDAIADLKRSGAGRATFLPLDTIRPAGSSRDNPGGDRKEDPTGRLLGIAADLVEYDPHYEPVVRQLLGRVLVVRDLPTARAELRKLSGGWTIVTLGGEQVNSGGAVTGGAQTKESGALRRERELRELPAQIDQRRSELEQTEQQRSALEQRSQRLTQQQRELEQRAREAQRAHDTARTGIEAATRRVEQANQELLWATQRRERLAADLAAVGAQITAAQAQVAEAEQAQAHAGQQLAALQGRQEAQNTADRAAQERLAGVRATVGEAEGQLRTQRALLAAQEQTQAQLTSQDEGLERETLTLVGERERYLAQHEQAELSHHALLVAIDDLRSQIDPAEASLHDDETRLADLEERETAATTTLLDAEAVHGRAALEAQRAIDRQEALFERAAADGIDVTRPLAPPPAFPQAAEGESAPATAVRADELQPAIDSLKLRILRLGVVNPLALAEYEEAAERHQFLSGQVSDLRQAGATLQELIAELDEAMQSRFQTTFDAVAVEFEQTFTQLFGGGSARLQLTNSGAERNGQAPEAEGAAPPPSRSAPGVDIIVRPPGKKQQNISLLSGGERSLTAAALLFAILRVNPSPFCILDETDAALDESNVGRFRDALRDLTANTQFILITHNRGTIEAADTLYGVTMGDDGGSKVMSLRVEEYVNAEA